MTGTIPAELGNLANLRHLSLHHNQLTGEIPSSLGNLTNLEYLYLSNNQLTGGIPAELGNLTNLQYLYLDYNQLTGGIPSSLGNLTNLEYLWLHQNQLTGRIPSSLGNLTNLEHLWLYDNQLTETIPPELGNLANLQRLYLSLNQFTGCIPAGLREVADNDFAELGLDFCGGEDPAPADDPLLERFDDNNSGEIEKDEVLQAISDYLFGVEGDVTKEDVLNQSQGEKCRDMGICGGAGVALSEPLRQPDRGIPGDGCERYGPVSRTMADGCAGRAPADDSGAGAPGAGTWYATCGF